MYNIHRDKLTTCLQKWLDKIPKNQEKKDSNKVTYKHNMKQNKEYFTHLTENANFYVGKELLNIIYKTSKISKSKNHRVSFLIKH